MVFRALMREHLEKILDIELGKVQTRIIDSLSPNHVFLFAVGPAARNFLLEEGVDRKSGARNLKRTIEKYIVAPLSNLISTGQIEGCDLVHVDHVGTAKRLKFTKKAGKS